MPRAKAIATLDGLSEGRFVWGFGWGWYSEEFQHLERMARDAESWLL